MLAPVPSVYQSTSDSIIESNTLFPSIPIESDAWRLLSPQSPTESTTTAARYHRTRSIPKARPSVISHPTSYHHHLHRRSSHHHNRPSKQFVATTSSSIFGDWDIELKIDRRTLAKAIKTSSAVGRVAPAAAGVGGGSAVGVGGGGSIVTIGAGPGVNTGSSGTQPLSTFPESSAAPASATAGGELSSTLKTLKDELSQTPTSTTKTFKSNTTTPEKATIATPTSTSTKTTISKNNNTQPPWKTGQPQKNTSANAMVAPTATGSTAVAATAKKSWSKPDADETMNNETASAVNALPAPSARSSFLRALGKFKSKHLQQKRSSAPPASLLPVIEQSPPQPVGDRRASYIIPPMQFDQSETQPLSSAPLGSTPGSAKGGQVTVSSVVVEPSPQQVSFADEHITEGTASLRIKFKNKVNSTLASMKSSSNLRERDRAQQAESSAAELSSSATGPPVATVAGVQGSTKHSERRQSAFVTSPIDQSDSHISSGSSSGKNRHSKNFWTFPRVRHESSQQSSSKARVPWGVDTTAVAGSGRPEESDTAMLSPELGPKAASASAAGEVGPSTLHQQLQGLHVDEKEEQPLDSDHSLDIIQLIDYEDYTQFAELPLKKRKKMERSLAAAAASSARDESGSRKPISVKRLLTKQQQQQHQDSKEQDKGTIEAQSQDVGGGTINSNKKRPQTATEPAESSSKRTGNNQAAEWRRSFLKSLHLGKGQQSSRKVVNVADSNPVRAQSPSPLDIIAEIPKEEQSSSQKAVPDSTRHARSESVISTRSRSLTRSSHPALLASTISKPRVPGLRRETLEMAMRRRRQSSAARSNVSDTEIPPPLPFSSEFFGMDNSSTTNITHTFTSFTLELAEMYAHDVVNNSAVPGLFNFKQGRAPRLTVSSHVMDMDTDQDFKGFESDGDAISGYTGDADVSMDEIHVGSTTPKSPKTPTLPSMPAAEMTTETTTAPQSSKTRDFGMKAVVARRKVSSVDGDSDTVPELPTLMIRTRDLNNRGSSGGYSRSARPLSGSSFEMDQDQFTNRKDSPRSPRRTQGNVLSPALSRKASRGILASPTSPSAGSRADPLSPSRSPLSMEEVVSWKPRNMYSHSSRPQVPILDTMPLKPSRGSGMLSSTTLVSSSRTPYSAAMTQSPGPISPGAGGNDREPFNRHHYQSSSSSSSNYPHHQQQTSSDTLVSQHHLRYISSGSTMSAGSGNSAHTLTGGHHQSQYPFESAPGAREFDPNDELSLSTPADLKAMDFEALLVTAEREHQKGWEDLMAQKKGSEYVSSRTSISTSSPTMTSFPIPPKSSLSSSTFQRPNIPPLKIANWSSKSSIRPGHLAPNQHQRNSVAFDLGPSDDGTGTGTGTGTGSDRSMRPKRVMKKKMSVIRLTGNGNGNVQGRREDDGVIRVSVSPTPYASTPPPPPSDGRW